MPITSRDDWIGSAKQRVLHYRTTVRTTVAGGWFGMNDVAGNPGAGVLAGSNTANGIVPTDAVAGYPIINAFGTSAIGYIGRVSVSNTVASEVALYDRVFHAGAYAFNANTSLVSIPSFAARIPGGLYSGLELWGEAVAPSTGNLACGLTYTNQSGATGRVTGAVGIGAVTTAGRCWPLPLQPGDSGMQAITNVAGSVATAGTFNVMVLRELWSGYVAAGSGYVDDMTRSGMREVYADSALFVMVMAPIGTSSGTPRLKIDIVNK